jgi:sulfonate transport system permease protein
MSAFEYPRLRTVEGLRTATGRAVRWPARVPGLRWLSPAALLAAWEIASLSGLLPGGKLDSPVAILQAAVDLVRDGQLEAALVVSLERAAVGFALGAVVAFGLGSVAGLNRTGDVVIDPPMQMVRTLPLFGLIPLFILWFGIGEASKVLLVALGALVPLYLNLVSALRGKSDPHLRELADSLRLTAWERLRHIVLPGALPAVLVGVRQSLGMAWLALIVAEQINTDSGLGYMVNNARDFLRTDIVVVGLCAYAVLGLLSDAAVRRLERQALRWQEEST